MRSAAHALALLLPGACSANTDLVAPGARFATKADPGYTIYVTGKAEDVTTSGHAATVYAADGGVNDDAGMNSRRAASPTRTRKGATL